MFAIDGDKIYLTRGDKAVISLSITNYTFQKDDKVEFRVYTKKGLEKVPVLSVVTKVTEETDSIEIVLPAEKTKIGEIQNKEVVYWYEIELNDEQTVLGFDENGPKEFILYPEGADADAAS